MSRGAGDGMGPETFGLQGQKHLLNHSRAILNRQDEPPHDKTNKTACASSEVSDQPGHPRMPRLIRVFAGRTLILLVLSCRGPL